MVTADDLLAVPRHHAGSKKQATNELALKA